MHTFHEQPAQLCPFPSQWLFRLHLLKRIFKSVDSNTKSLKAVFCKSLFWFGFIFLIGWPKKRNQKGNWTCNTIEKRWSRWSVERAVLPGGRPWVLQNAGMLGARRQHVRGEAAAEAPWRVLVLPSLLLLTPLFLFGCAGVFPDAQALLQPQSPAPLCGASLLWGTGSRLLGFGSGSSGAGSRGLRCPMACGIFPDQGSNLCSLRWQADYLPLSHQGSPSLPSFYNLSLA